MKQDMSHRMWARISTATAVVLFGATAAPALSADELWHVWQNNRTANGYQVRADAPTRVGDTTTYRNIVITGQTQAQADGTSVQTDTRIDIAQMALQELPDGRVRMTLAPEINAHSETLPQDSEPVSVDLKLTQEGLTTLVSGTPEALSYRLDAPKMTLTLVDAQTSTSAAQTSPISMQMVMQNTRGDYATTGDDTLQTQTSSLIIDQVDLTGGGVDDERGDRYTVTASAKGVTGTSRFSAPVDVADLDAALDKGASYAFTGQTGPIAFSYAQSGGARAAHLVASAKGASMTGTVTAEGLRYATQAQDQRLELLQSPDPSVPAPLSVDVARSNAEFSIPLSQSGAEQPYTGKIGLSDVTASDSVWGIIDPTGALPRDPAQLALEVDGTVRLTSDLFSTQPLPTDISPIEVQTLRLSRLNLSLAGMTLGGTGAVTFDNTTGVAVPAGTMTLNLTGIGGLMQKLVDIGMIEQQQTLIAQMMLGLYAVRSGDDSYTSLIEMKPTGAIVANGQQIR